ncbi:MAG: hypothetical protein AAFZ15_24755 [Bacteroidota bacterium]
MFLLPKGDGFGSIQLDGKYRLWQQINQPARSLYEFAFFIDFFEITTVRFTG